MDTTSLIVQHSGYCVCALYNARIDSGQVEVVIAHEGNSLKKILDGHTFTSVHALKIPVSVGEEFSPDAVAGMEFAAQAWADICARMYALYPRFGAAVEGLPDRYRIAWFRRCSQSCQPTRPHFLPVALQINELTFCSHH